MQGEFDKARDRLDDIIRKISKVVSEFHSPSFPFYYCVFFTSYLSAKENSIG